ncbi:CRAL TRIO domain-containing protein [Flagelloscypha sp. PMI_526]|nr:CRAL TRIO domain-containing protein [Flagelloscypha sp. PMI_526]
MSTSKVFTPLPPPENPLVSASPLELSAQQVELYKAVEDHFSEESFKLSGWSPEKEASLSEKEKFWLSHECILRFLRAVKWASAEQAIQRLEATLTWRREYGVTSFITSDYIESEAVTGKEVLFGFDYWGSPGFYLIPSRQNTTDLTRQVQYGVWMLERCVDFMAPGVETLDLLVNFADKSKAPSISQAREALHILQTHYPERLRFILILNVPWILNAFFTLITPFIDPLTAKKMKFNPTVVGSGPEVPETFFLKEQVMKESWGGEPDFEYKHEEYWPKLVKMAEERHEAWFKRWKELGGKVGIKEVDYKTLNA